MGSDLDVYRKLQKHLDNMPVAFPESDIGLDIKLLKHRFTPKEAEIALELSALPEPLERIHKRLAKTGVSQFSNKSSNTCVGSITLDSWKLKGDGKPIVIVLSF